MGHKVLVTPRSLTEAPHPAIEGMARQGVEIVYATSGKLPDEAELLRLVPDVTGWLAGVEPVSPKVIAAASRLCVVSRNGTGLDNLPLGELKSRGIAVRTADGANARGVAELAIAMIFSAMRHLPYTDQGLKAGSWPRRRGIEFFGRTIGIIGCGAVGGTVARLAAAMGAHVMAFDPARPDVGIDPARFRWAKHDEIFREADILTLHCPPSKDRALVNRDMLAAVKPGLILVNTARSSLVDEAALIEALDAKQLRSYCVDVFDPEPPAFPGLASRADVIASSHIGGYTEESVNRATEMAVFNLMESFGLKQHALTA
ncbi:oxidoreductase [Rhizobium laguerreae]|uniref:NAD(P)-dependent oxidoreductase n=1 Tax=Rhizobium laguerreae TaxID=1076926 RepID=UPI0014415331|nr:NAD(P)-dependent oxidoreductase [Rhizobium laguerreae]MBY3075382.1 oxidoreductase [Rhizobium laguerreae]NKM31949.1 oxidoreductase [Rhizobium laguerreae]